MLTSFQVSGRGGEVLKEGFEKLPISCFPNSSGEGRGGGQEKVKSDCRVVTMRGGIVYPPVGECIGERWIRQGKVYDCSRSVVCEGRSVSPIKQV